MVYVGMGDEKKFYVGRLIDIDIPVPFLYFRIPLMHPAVNSKSMVLSFDNVAGTGYCPCRPHEFYFHKHDPQKFPAISNG
jgi:hypothetical protein